MFIALLLLYALFFLTNANDLAFFDFLREECLSGTYYDKLSFSNLGNLERIGGSSCFCPNSNGVSEGIQLSSTAKISQLQKSVKNEVGFFFWLQPGNNRTADFTIFSIPSSSKYCSSSFEIAFVSTEMQIGKAGIQIRFCNSQGSTGIISTNFKIPTNEKSATEMSYYSIQLHFSNYSISKAFQLFEVYANVSVNGALLPTDPIQTLNTHFLHSAWPQSTNALIFPSTKCNLENKKAVLYSFTISDKVHSLNDISERMSFQLPSNPLIIEDFVATVKENGETGDHSYDPSYYLTPIPNSELDIIYFRFYCLDYDWSNPQFNSSKGIPIHLFITNVSHGDIYTIDGTPLNLVESGEVELLINRSTLAFPIRFRPVEGIVSPSLSDPVAFISYYAMDFRTGQRTLTMTCSIIVQPPFSLSNHTSIGFAKTFIPINITGIADEGSYLSLAEISAFPKNGQLLRFQDLLTPMNNTSNQIPFHGMKYITFYYYYQESESSPNPLTGLLYSDSFTFTLINNYSSKSILISYNIDIYSAILLSDNYHYLVAERSISYLPIPAIDLSNEKRNLFIQVLNTTNYATLSLTNNSNFFPGYLTATNYSRGISVPYLSNQYYFTIPNRTFTGGLLNMSEDSFSFTAVTMKDQARSILKVATIAIRNVNDPTSIQFQTKTSENLSTSELHVDVGSTTDLIYQGINISGFHLIDPDYEVSPIKVEIMSSGTSHLQLNPKAYPLLDFNSHRYCLRNIKNWLCQGNAQVGGNHFIFVTTPAGLEMALNGMVYRNSEYNGNFTVTIYDGVGDQCFLSTQLDQDTIYQGCFITQFTLTVSFSLTRDSFTFTNSSSSILSERLQYVAIVLICLFILICCRCCYRYRVNRSNSKETGKKEGELPISQSSQKKKESDDDPSIVHIHHHHYSHLPNPLNLPDRSTLPYPMYVNQQERRSSAKPIEQEKTSLDTPMKDISAKIGKKRKSNARSHSKKTQGSITEKERRSKRQEKSKKLDLGLPPSLKLKRISTKDLSQRESTRDRNAHNHRSLKQATLNESPSRRFPHSTKRVSNHNKEGRKPKQEDRILTNSSTIAKL